mmetsp:Transcript_38436/g.96474  ORF Transcript_38436/g.96474 Transcript_38436/m.96474 type:complete len:202 (-) Transcript_38436:710-1315(-)
MPSNISSGPAFTTAAACLASPIKTMAERSLSVGYSNLHSSTSPCRQSSSFKVSSVAVGGSLVRTSLLLSAPKPPPDAVKPERRDVELRFAGTFLSLSLLSTTSFSSCSVSSTFPSKASASLPCLATNSLTMPFCALCGKEQSHSTVCKPRSHSPAKVTSSSDGSEGKSPLSSASPGSSSSSLAADASSSSPPTSVEVRLPS